MRRGVCGPGPANADDSTPRALFARNRGQRGTKRTRGRMPHPLRQGCPSTVQKQTSTLPGTAQNRRESDVFLALQLELYQNNRDEYEDRLAKKSALPFGVPPPAFHGVHTERTGNGTRRFEVYNAASGKASHTRGGKVRCIKSWGSQLS